MRGEGVVRPRPMRGIICVLEASRSLHLVNSTHQRGICSSEVGHKTSQAAG